jgi:hypothetical protein
MKRTSILAAILCLSFGLLYGQMAPAPATLNWGDDYNEPNGTAATKIIGTTGEGFYVLRQRILNNPNAKPRAWVEYFTRDMKLKRSEEMELKYKGKQRDFEEVVLLNGRLYLLTSFNNTAKKRNYLFKQELSDRTLIPSKNLEMICETEAKNKEVEGTFDFKISKDSSKLLVYNSLPNENKNPERFGFHVFNENFDLIWEKNVILPYPDNQFTVEDYQVDNRGNVHLLGVLYKDEAKWRRRGNPTYNYVVLSYTGEGSEAKEFRIDLPDKFITDLTFRVAGDGTLICCGFYSERGTYSVKGAYYFRLDPVTGDMTNRNYQAFDFEFLTEFMSEKSKQKAREAEINNDVNRSPELYNYSLDELILRSDGGAVLVAEQFYIETETYRDFPFGYQPFGFYSPYNFRNDIQTDYFYHYNDIIVVNIRPSGEIEWAARIPKQQETRNDGGYYSSYSMSIVRDKLYFIFNDNVRNYSPDRKENRFYTYTGNESIMVMAQLSTSGEVKTFPMASNKDAGVITRPKMCKQIGKRDMAIFGERGRSFRFGNLSFE